MPLAPITTKAMWFSLGRWPSFALRAVTSCLLHQVVCATVCRVCSVECAVWGCGRCALAGGCAKKIAWLETVWVAAMLVHLADGDGLQGLVVGRCMLGWS